MSACTRSEKKYYRLTSLGRTGKRNPRLGEDFVKWIDEESIISGYIVDRTGFEEFKKLALKANTVYWNGIHYD